MADERPGYKRVGGGWVRDEESGESMAQRAAEYRKQRIAESLHPSDDEIVAANVPDDLSTLTVPELEELAEERGVEVTSGMLKADIVTALETAENDDDGADDDGDGADEDGGDE